MPKNSKPKAEPTGEVSLFFPETIDEFGNVGVTITAHSKSECRRIHEQRYGAGKKNPVQSEQ